MGIRYTAADLAADFKKATKTQFPTTASLDAFLKSSGESKADILFQIRVSEIYKKLVARASTKVDAASIAKYYAAHKATFGTKESRSLHLVRTSSAAKAQAAYNALKSGQSWNAVATQYSASATAAKNGGLLTGVTTGEEETAVNSAIFGNPVGKVVGPIKGLLGSYVIEVTKIIPATQKTLAQSTAQIKTLITSQHWGKQTLCRSTYSIADCVGYKAPPATTTTATPTTEATTPATTTTTVPATTTTAASTTTTATQTTGTGTSTTG